ncbi:MAG: methyltransferase domain-containing protein [Propionibacteriaceae bacterium]
MNRHLRRAVLAFSIRNRKIKAALVRDFLTQVQAKNAIFVGCSPGTNPNEGIVERAVSDLLEVRAACDVLASEVDWPFVLADGRALPFGTRSCDFILANAVIEHVGDAEDQERFVAEQTRVAKHWVITTPNRWFPVESHTSTILLHWLPGWRRRRPEFSRLLSRREFIALLPTSTEVRGRPWSATFTAFHSAVEPEESAA